MRLLWVDGALVRLEKGRNFLYIKMADRWHPLRKMKKYYCE